MVVYIDQVFLLNALADGAALYAAGRLSGLAVRWPRLLGAAALGGVYGAVCALPGWGLLASLPAQAAAAAGLTRLAFGSGEAPGRGLLIRQTLLFTLLSCALAGALVAGERLLASQGGLGALDWRVFFLAGGLCFVILSVVFRGGARHGMAGQLCRCTLERRGRRAVLTALWDTGHTLTDGLSGRPVLTAAWTALLPLWTEEERRALSRLESEGPAACLAALGPGFRLLPYRAVGVERGLLLCFRADRAALDGRELGEVTVALSPTAVSDGGGYAALWGGEGGKEGGGYAA